MSVLGYIAMMHWDTQLKEAGNLISLPHAAKCRADSMYIEFLSQAHLSYRRDSCPKYSALILSSICHADCALERQKSRYYCARMLDTVVLDPAHRFCTQQLVYSESK